MNPPRLELLARQSRPRLLVVEDDPDVAELYALFLGDLVGNAEVVVVDNGVDAFRAAVEQGPFHVVLCDMMIPRLDGARLVKALAESPSARHTPVVVVSGMEPSMLAAVLALPNVVGHFRKPVDPEILCRRLAQVIDHRTRARAGLP